MLGPQHTLLSIANLLDTRLSCQPASTRPIPTWFQYWHVSINQPAFIEVSRYRQTTNAFLLKKHACFHLKSMILRYMCPPTRTGSRSRGCSWKQGKPCMFPVQSDPSANRDISNPDIESKDKARKKSIMIRAVD